MWFTYILCCSDGSLYTGITNDLQARIETHNAGKGARYTRSRRPVRLVGFERFRSKPGAMRREIEIKALPRPEKLRLVRTLKGSVRANRIR